MPPKMTDGASTSVPKKKKVTFACDIDEQSLMKYSKPVFVYQKFKTRLKDNPYFLRRCLSYIIKSKKKRNSNSDGKIIFNYMDHNDKILKSEVVNNFSCPFCSMSCGGLEGMPPHLMSSHGVFDFKFWAEEQPEIDVSLKPDAFRLAALKKDLINPQMIPYSFCSKRRKRRQSNDGNNVKRLNVRFLEMDLDDDTENGLSHMSDDNVSSQENTHSSEYTHSSPENVLSSPENTHSSSENTHSSQKNVYSSPENAHSPPENIPSSPENIHSSPEKAHSSPENIHSSPENTHSSQKNNHSSPENAHSSPENVHSSPENAHSSPENSHSSAKNSQSSAENAHSSPENAHSSPDNIHSSPENTHSSPKNAHPSPENMHSSPENARSSPENAHSSPENTHSSPENTHSSPENTHSSPENTHSSPENDDSSPENDHSSAENQYSSPENVYSSPENTHSSPKNVHSTPENTHSSPQNDYSSPQNVHSSPEKTHSSSEKTHSSPQEKTHSSPPENTCNILTTTTPQQVIAHSPERTSDILTITTTTTQQAIAQSSEPKVSLSRRKKLFAEKREAKRVDNLKSRQFYHSGTTQPMTLEKVMADEDSEDELDDESADLEEQSRLGRLKDESEDEKRFMYLWNTFVRKQRVVADGHIPWTCEEFTKLHKKELVASKSLSWMWRLFMIKLWKYGLVSPKIIDKCNTILQSSEEAGPSTSQAATAANANEQQNMELD